MRTDQTSGSDERWERLARFLTGESTPEETAEVERWLAADPARSALLAEIRATLGHVRFVPPADLDVEAALSALHRRMGKPDVLPLRPARPPAPLWLRPALRNVAALVVLLGAAALFLLRGRDAPATLAASATYQTATGQLDTLTLADGSRVILAAASRLVVPAGYGEEKRMLELRGVAWFQVRHLADRPFIVRAGNAVITDLGTSFTVRADPAAPVTVTVTEGSVRLAPDARPSGGVILEAGQRATLGGPVLPAPAAAPDVAWTSGRLVFDDAPFAHVAAEVRRWYGVELVAGDAVISGRHLSAEFEGEAAADVLRVIALALGARLEQRADTVVLHNTR